MVTRVNVEIHHRGNCFAPCLGVDFSMEISFINDIKQLLGVYEISAYCCSGEHYDGFHHLREKDTSRW